MEGFMLGKPQLLITPCSGPNLNTVLELEASIAHYSCKVLAMVYWLASLSLGSAWGSTFWFLLPGVTNYGQYEHHFLTDPV